MRIRSYRDLDVWRKAVDLTVECYRLTRSLPRDERFGLSAQIRRAAISVAANIAEGHGRTHRGDYLRHLSIAHGSLTELETHLLIATRLQYVDCSATACASQLSSDVSRMLARLKAALRRQQPSLRPGPRAPGPGPRA